MFSDLINGTKDLAQTKHRFLQYYILTVDFPQEHTLFSLNFGATFRLFSGSQVLLFSHLSLMVLVLSLDLKNWKWFEIKSRKITGSEFCSNFHVHIYNYLYSLDTVPLNAKYIDILDHKTSKSDEMYIFPVIIQGSKFLLFKLN